MTRKVSCIMQGSFYGVCAALVAAFFVLMSSQPQVLKAEADKKPMVATQ